MGLRGSGPLSGSGFKWKCSHSLNAPAWHATSHVLYARTPSAARRMVHADVDMLSARPAWPECMHRLAVKRSPKETGASSRAPYRRNTTGGTGGTVYSRTACNFRMPCLYAAAFPTDGRRTAAPPRALTVMTSMPAVSTYWLMTCIGINAYVGLRKR